MLVLGVNRVLNWVQVLSNGRKYTCPIVVVNGESFFHFKKQLHSVAAYLSDHAEEWLMEGGKYISRPIKK